MNNERTITTENRDLEATRAAINQALILAASLQNVSAMCKIQVVRRLCDALEFTAP